MDLRDERPTYYVIPRQLVSAYLELSYRLGSQRLNEADDNTSRTLGHSALRKCSFTAGGVGSATQADGSSAVHPSFSTSQACAVSKNRPPDITLLAPWLRRNGHDPDRKLTQ